MMLREEEPLRRPLFGGCGGQNTMQSSPRPLTLAAFSSPRGSQGSNSHDFEARVGSASGIDGNASACGLACFVGSASNGFSASEHLVGQANERLAVRNGFGASLVTSTSTSKEFATCRNVAVSQSKSPPCERQVNTRRVQMSTSPRAHQQSLMACSSSVSMVPVPAVMNIRERELEARAMMRRKSFGSLESSWLVKNCFASWRMSMHLRVALAVREREMTLAVEEAVTLQQVRELQLAVAQKDAIIQELLQRMEMTMMHERGQRREIVVRAVDGAVGAHSNRVSAVHLLRWAFTALRMAVFGARLSRKVSELETQHKERVVDLESRHCALHLQVEERAACVEADWNRQLDDLKAAHVDREEAWGVQLRRAEDRGLAVARQRSYAAADVRMLSQAQRLLSLALAAWLRSAKYLTVERLQGVHADREEEWTMKLRTERELVVQDSETRLRSQLASVHAEWEAKHQAVLDSESKAAARRRAEFAAFEEGAEAKLHKERAVAEHQGITMRSEHASAEQLWEIKLQSQMAKLEDELNVRLRSERAAVEQEYDGRLRSRLANVEREWESKCRSERTTTNSEWELRLRTEIASVEAAYEARIRQDRIDRDQERNTRLKDRISAVEQDFESRSAKELEDQRQEADAALRAMRATVERECERRFRAEMSSTEIRLRNEFASTERELEARLHQAGVDGHRWRLAESELEAQLKRSHEDRTNGDNVWSNRLKQMSAESQAERAAEASRFGAELQRHVALSRQAHARHAGQAKSRGLEQRLLLSYYLTWVHCLSSSRLQSRAAEDHRRVETQLHLTLERLQSSEKAEEDRTAALMQGQSELELHHAEWTRRYDDLQRARTLTELQLREEADKKWQDALDVTRARGTAAAIALLGGKIRGVLCMVFAAWAQWTAAEHRERLQEEAKSWITKHQVELARSSDAAYSFLDRNWRGRLLSEALFLWERLLDEKRLRHAADQVDSKLIVAHEAAMSLAGRGLNDFVLSTAFREWHNAWQKGQWENHVEGRLEDERRLYNEKRCRKDVVAHELVGWLFSKRTLSEAFLAWWQVTRDQQWQARSNVAAVRMRSKIRAASIEVASQLAMRGSSRMVLAQVFGAWLRSKSLGDTELARVEVARQRAMLRERTRGLAHEAVRGEALWRDRCLLARTVANWRQGCFHLRFEASCKSMSVRLDISHARHEFLTARTLNSATRGQLRFAFGVWQGSLGLRARVQVVEKRRRRSSLQLEGWGRKYIEQRCSTLWYRVVLLWRLWAKLEMLRRKLAMITRHNIRVFAEKAQRFRNNGQNIVFVVWCVNAAANRLGRTHGELRREVCSLRVRASTGQTLLSTMVCNRESTSAFRIAYLQWLQEVLQSRHRRAHEARTGELTFLRQHGLPARLRAATKVWSLHGRLLLFAVITAWRQRLLAASNEQSILQMRGVVASMKQRALNAVRSRRRPQVVLERAVALWRGVVLESRAFHERTKLQEWGAAIEEERQEHDNFRDFVLIRTMVARWHHFAVSVRYFRMVDELRAQKSTLREQRGLVCAETVICSMEERQRRLMLWEAWTKWGLLVRAARMSCSPAPASTERTISPRICVSSGAAAWQLQQSKQTQPQPQQKPQQQQPQPQPAQLVSPKLVTTTPAYPVMRTCVVQSPPPTTVTIQQPSPTVTVPQQVVTCAPWGVYSMPTVCLTGKRQPPPLLPSATQQVHVQQIRGHVATTPRGHRPLSSVGSSETLRGVPVVGAQSGACTRAGSLPPTWQAGASTSLVGVRNGTITPTTTSSSFQYRYALTSPGTIEGSSVTVPVANSGGIQSQTSTVSSQQLRWPRSARATYAGSKDGCLSPMPQERRRASAGWEAVADFTFHKEHAGQAVEPVARTAKTDAAASGLVPAGFGTSRVVNTVMVSETGSPPCGPRVTPRQQQVRNQQLQHQMQLQQQPQPQSIEAATDAVFRALDSNHDGVISRDEWMRFGMEPRAETLTNLSGGDEGSRRTWTPQKATSQRIAETPSLSSRDEVPSLTLSGLRLHRGHVTRG